MLLRAISPSDPVTNLVLEGLLMSAPILQDAEFYSRAGAADAPKKARDGGTTGIFRSINEDNTATPPENTYPSTAKKIVSFDVKVDTVLEDRNEDPEAELATQTRLEAEDAGWLLQEKFFTGDVDSDAEEFDGFGELIPVANIKPVATHGLQIVLGNTDTKVTAQQTAVEALQKFFATVRGGATHAYMNEYLKIRLLSMAKSLGYYRLSKDELGNEIERIGQVAIRGAGYKKDGTPLLPFNETVGNSTDCSSIFACRWGERVNLTCLTSVGVKATYAGQIGNFLINNVNLDMAIILQSDSALHKSTGWRLG